MSTLSNDRQLVRSLLQLHGVKVASEPIYDLSSGEKSRYYVDVKAVSMHSRVQQPLANILAAEVNSYAPDAVAGVELGGCHLASIMAATRWSEAPLDVIYIRKEPKKHGTKQRIESLVIKGARVVLVEDVVTTGGSSLKAIEWVREAGHEVVGIVAVVDRRTVRSPTLGGLKFKALFDLEDLV